MEERASADYGSDDEYEMLERKEPRCVVSKAGDELPRVVDVLLVVRVKPLRVSRRVCIVFGSRDRCQCFHDDTFFYPLVLPAFKFCRPSG